MPTRQSRWAETKRHWLLRALGGCCRKCGATNCLTFDCIVPTGDGHHRLNKANRMTYYCRQAEKGNLQVLCASCNSIKGSRLDPYYSPVKPT
jgi:5-methylcytosine-specific restriction endonuclease McrA